jgi:hypothetical protein
MGSSYRIADEHISTGFSAPADNATSIIPAPAEGPVMITNPRGRRTNAARTRRQLRRLIHEASTSAHRNDLLAVAAQANWWR